MFGQVSFRFGPELNESDSVNSLVKHVTELKEPHVISRDFSFHFKHI